MEPQHRRWLATLEARMAVTAVSQEVEEDPVLGRAEPMPMVAVELVLLRLRWWLRVMVLEQELS